MTRLLFALCALSLAACIRNPDHNALNDAGMNMTEDMSVPVDMPPNTVYDPVQGMPVSGDLLLDDERVRAVDPSTLPAASPPCREPVLVYIRSGIDGDTLVVDELGGEMTANEHVRLIGVNSPEIMHGEDPAECYGPEARDFTRGLAGRVAWLTFGTSCVDIYDRTLAFLHFGAGRNDMYQHQLLRRGLARVYTFSDNRTFASEFEADGEAAEAANVGLWAVCE